MMSTAPTDGPASLGATTSAGTMMTKFVYVYPDSKVHEAYMGPTWGREDPGGSHVGLMNLAIRVGMEWRG